MVICEFSDTKPDYITEDSALAGFSDGKGSVSHFIEAASYGRMVMSRHESSVVTVQIGKAWSDISDIHGCPVQEFQELGDLAMDKVRQKYMESNTEWNNFSFREFFLPRHPKAGGCKWWGISAIGCGHPRNLAHAGDSSCNQYYTRGFPYVRAFQFGQSFGLGDADGPVFGKWLENGDRSDIMGSSYALTPYSAPAAYQLGWLRDVSGEVLTWDSGTPQSLVHLRSISATELAGHDDFIAVKVPCPSCVPQVPRYASQIGGHMWVSFRGSEGYSSYKLESKWQNKVYIHLARHYTSEWHGKGTELWSVLGSGEAFQSNGFAFVACSVANGTSTVAIAANEASARKSCK